MWCLSKTVQLIAWKRLGGSKSIKPHFYYALHHYFFKHILQLKLSWNLSILWDPHLSCGFLQGFVHQNVQASILLPADRRQTHNLDGGRGQAGFIQRLGGGVVPSCPQQRQHHGSSCSGSGNTRLWGCSGRDCIWHDVSSSSNQSQSFRSLDEWDSCSSSPQVKRLPCGRGGGDWPWWFFSENSEEESS